MFLDPMSVGISHAAFRDSHRSPFPRITFVRDFFTHASVNKVEFFAPVVLHHHPLVENTMNQMPVPGDLDARITSRTQRERAENRPVFWQLNWITRLQIIQPVEQLVREVLVAFQELGPGESTAYT